MKSHIYDIYIYIYIYMNYAQAGVSVRVCNWGYGLILHTMNAIVRP